MFGLDLEANAAVLAVVVVLGAAIVTLGYHNTTSGVRLSLLSKREGRGSSQAAKADIDRNTTVEATLFGVLFNNCVFLLVTYASALFVFSSAAPITSAVLSISAGATAASFVTASQLH